MAQAQDGKRRKRGGLWAVVTWIALAVFLFSAGYLAVIAFSYWNDAHRYQEISDTVFTEPDPTGDLADMTVDWDALKKINPEVVGWVYIPDTVVSYPICWSGDNAKYLDVNFDGAQGVWTGSGTIFLDGEGNVNFTDHNLVLYGHHMNDGSMFACLSDFAAEEVFEEHRTVYVLTPMRNFEFKSFSLVRTVGSDRLVTLKFPLKSQMTAYIKDKQERSMVVPAEGFVDAADVVQLLTLSTCDYNEPDGRAVLFCSLEDSVRPRSSAGTVVGSAADYVAPEE